MPNPCVKAQPWAAVPLMIALALGASSCTRALDSGRLADAQLAVRIKTALVNDAEVGVYPIEVQVAAGVARLSGRVESQSQVERAVALAHAVPGVRDVTSQLVIGAIPPAFPDVPPPSVDPAPAADQSDRGVLAVGVSLGRNMPSSSDLDPNLRVSPLFRLGTGDGLGVVIGFGWFAADLTAAGARERLGVLRVKPVMAGVGYTFRGVRTSAGLSLVGGLAFNSVKPHTPRFGTDVALTADNSFAWRPAFSLWHEVSGRIAFNLSFGYVFTSPRATFLLDDRVTAATVRADTAMATVGLAYKVF
jgi:hypothetical protein